jgi:protein-ribulosamine 3-kinase
MCEGEFESMKAINAVSPTFAPRPWAWGKYKSKESYFIIADFREVGEQPPDPVKFTARLAELHKNSISPTGKFGFHTTTCHGTTPQVTNTWEDSWEKLYRRQLSHMFAIDLEKHGKWPEFEYLCHLTLTKVILRLLGPLQSEGRNIKPCLLHGDCWDENTGTDMETGEPFVFDAGSFYGHNEYETGNWRAPRHRLSSRVYMRNYKRNFPVSEPGEYINAWCRYLISNSSKCRAGLGRQKLALLLTFQYRNSDLDTGLQPT